MLNEIKNRVFSFSGLFITLGVLGFLSGVTGLFIDINKDLSVKWLLFTILISLSLLVILLKLIYDISIKKEDQKYYEVPISYIESDRIFVIKKNDNFINSIIVGGYLVSDQIENLAFIGVIHHVQDKVIQVRIIWPQKLSDANLPNKVNLPNFIIKPVIPTNALNLLGIQEASNE
jgi:hypothetical protein